MSRLVRTTKALLDVFEIAADHIGQDDFSAAEKFVDATEKTFAFLVANPHLGDIWEPAVLRYPNLRCCTVQGFRKHLIFFQPLVDGIRVIRVLHAARNLPALLES